MDAVEFYKSMKRMCYSGEMCENALYIIISAKWEVFVMYYCTSQMRRLPKLKASLNNGQKATP